MYGGSLGTRYTLYGKPYVWSLIKEVFITARLVAFVHAPLIHTHARGHMTLPAQHNTELLQVPNDGNGL